MIEFSSMVAKPAKSPGELLSLITEMDRRMKMLEDVTGEPVPAMMAKAVLIGILDPITRQHTATVHALQYDKLKPTVMEFASNATNNSGEAEKAMQMDYLIISLWLSVFDPHCRQNTDCRPPS